jgi:hypothetical protein
MKAQQSPIIEDTVLAKLRLLPPEKKREVIDFVDFLQQKIGPKRKRRSIKGLWAGLGISVSESDISDIRQEMWDKFPREDF